MRLPCLAVSLMALAAAAPAAADTLQQALAEAYKTNPTITAGRANLRAADEGVPIARAAGLPQLTSSGGYVENVLSTSQNSFNSPDRQATAGLDLTVPFYTGGAVTASVRGAETRVLAERATLRGTESDLFTAVVGAYQDVIRDEAIVGLNQQNVRVLEVNLQATRDRFEVGDLTRTDVAQSEARLAVARSQLRTAEAQLITSREQYIRIIGVPPGRLEPAPALPNLPADPNAAVAVAVDQNPALNAARQRRDASAFDVDLARASRSPRLSVVLGGNYQNYLGSLGSGAAAGVRVGQDSVGGTAGVALQVPLFQGGRPAAEVRQAEARRSFAIEGVTNAERFAVSQTRSAFAAWRAAQDVIKSSEVAVEANRLSLEGVRAENSVGTRTILDILDAERELLNAQVQLVSARRDEYVAGFALLAAMGQADASDLGLEGGTLYDPEANYKDVRHRISDRGSPAPSQPVATSTRDTPPQTPVITQPPQDPLLQRPVDRTPVDPETVQPAPK